MARTAAALVDGVVGGLPGVVAWALPGGSGLRGGNLGAKPFEAAFLSQCVIVGRRFGGFVGAMWAAFASIDAAIGCFPSVIVLALPGGFG